MKYGTRVHGASSLKLRVAKALPLVMRQKVVELSALRTADDARGQGHASALMFATTAEADAAGLMLMLHVEPEDGTDRTRLVEFYQRHGFMVVQAQPMLMVRAIVGLQ